MGTRIVRPRDGPRAWRVVSGCCLIAVAAACASAPPLCADPPVSSAAGGVAAGDGPEPPAEAPLSESEVRESDSLEEAMVSPDAATRTRDEWLALRASLDALVQAHAESRLAARWEYLALVVTCPDGEACTEPDAAVVRERSARLEALEQRHPGDPIVVAGALRVADVTSRAHRFVAAAHALEIGRRAIAGAPERQRELDVRVARVELALRMTEVVGLGTAGREYTRWVTELSAELEDLRDAIRRERESVPDASSVSDTTIAMVGEVVLCFPTYADLDPDSFTALVATIGLERLEIARVAIVLGHVALARGENGARPLRILRDAQVIADDTVSLTTDDVASIAGLVCATRSPLSAIETRAMEARGLVTPLACPQNAGLDRQVAMRVLYEVHFELNACRSAPPTRGDPPAAPIARISADEAGSPHVVIATPSRSRIETACAERVLAAHPSFESPVLLGSPVEVSLWEPLTRGRFGCRGPLCGLRHPTGGNSVPLGDDPN